MNKKVLKHLEKGGSFGSGIALYTSLPGHNRALVASLQRGGDTQENRKQLNYELGKLSGIPERKLNRLIAKASNPVIKSDPKAGTHKPKNTVKIPIGDDFKVEDLTYQQMKAKAKELGLKPEGKKKVDFEKALSDYLAQKKS